jgi:hypothetical protein
MSASRANPSIGENAKMAWITRLRDAMMTMKSKHRNRVINNHNIHRTP